MITTQGDREMHSNISIDLSRKNNSKSSYSNQRTYSHSTRNTSSQTLYAQAVNWQLKNPEPTKRTTHTTASTNWTTTHTRTVTRTTNVTTNTARTSTSRTNYTQWADKTLSSVNFLKHRNQAPTQSIADLKKLVKKDEIPVKVFWLGWLEEIWINMTVIEYKDDIIIVDAGLEFASFDMHGVDYIIPDISYLIPKKKNIKWILITHGHLDHIWAIKHILSELDYPIVYTTPLALGLIKRSQNDQDQKKMKYKIIDPDIDIIKLWEFLVEPFRVNHSIPESMWYAIHTPKWNIVHSWDFKIDFVPAIDKPADLGKISRIGQEWVKLYLWESTNARTPWHTPSEKLIGENLERVITRHSTQRIIISTFASNIWRIIQIIESAVKHNRVIFLAWRSMIWNVQLCQELGYINVPKDMIRIVSGEIDNMPDERVMILCTWSQWEEFSALVRMATNTYKDFMIRPWDCILLSSHTIPGNEKAVWTLMNNLIDMWIDLVDEPTLALHTSGHSCQEDMKEMMALLKPEYFCPIHWEALMRHAHKKIALDMRIPEEKILLPKNGQIVELYDECVLLSDKKVKLDTVTIDWKWQWHLSWEYVTKARGIMWQDWVVSLIFKIDTKTKELVWNLQIESRWFVYSSEVKPIHTQIVEFARAKYNENLKKKMDIKENLRTIKDLLEPEIEKIIWRVPMIIPMYVYINREALTTTEKPNDDEEIIWMTLEEQGWVE